MDSSQGKFSSVHWAGEGGGWAGRGRGALPLFLLSPVYKLIAAQLCLALEMALSPCLSFDPLFPSAAEIFVGLSDLWGQPGSRILPYGLRLGLLTGSSKKSPRRTFLSIPGPKQF